jgi:hypothetical protein
MLDCIYIKPIFWRIPKNLSNNYIKIIGYNSFHEKFSINVNTYNTYILKFNIPINDNILQEIKFYKFIKSYKILNDFLSSNNHINDNNINDINIKDINIKDINIKDINIKDYINNNLNNNNLISNNFNNEKYLIVRSDIKLSKENFVSNFVSNGDDKSKLIIDNIDEVIECDDKLKTFWQYNNIEPYNWLKIENYTKKIVNPHLILNNKSIIVDECNISVNNNVIIDTEKLLIWDIRFVDKKILMISIITIFNKDVKGYIIFNNKFGNRGGKEGVKEGVKPLSQPDAQHLVKHPSTGCAAFGGLIQNKLNNIEIFNENSNKQIIKKFIDIVQDFNPYRQLYYSNNNPNLEKFFSRINLCSKIFSNIEIINLYEYYKIFNNYYEINCFNNLKKYFLKNTYLPTTNEKILENLNSNNFNKILLNAYYDSYDIYELIKKDEILQKLEKICNKLGCTIYDLHSSNFNNIFPILNLTIFKDILKEPIINYNKNNFGIYKNVYVYDYIEIYRQIMLLSENKLTQMLAYKLENAPAKLIYEIFNSKYLENDMKKIKLFFKYVYENYEIISIDNQYMFLKNKIKSNILKQIDNLKCLVYTKDNNIIRLDKKNNIYSTIHISFILAYDIIGMFLSKRQESSKMKESSKTNKIKKFIIPNIKKLEYEKFIITDKNNTSKYIMSDNGSVSVNLINNSTIINYSYYIELLNNYLSLFENI